MANNLERELATYAAKLPELSAQQGKFVLVQGADVVGTFDTYGDALSIGYERFRLERFLIKQVGEKPLIRREYFSCL
jgi:hypothetical protein